MLPNDVGPYHISAGGLAGADHLDDLAALQAVVAGDGVGLEDARQLGLLQLVAREQRLLLLVVQHLVLRHQLVLRDVHHQLVVQEHLQRQLVAQPVDDLRGEGGGLLLQHQHRPLHLLLPHLQQVPVDLLLPELLVRGREEREQLVRAVRLLARGDLAALAPAGGGRRRAE